MISDCIYDDILPQMKILNMVIHILMYFLNFTKTLYFVQNASCVSEVNHYVDKSLATLLLTSGFRRYIAGYTVTNS